MDNELVKKIREFNRYYTVWLNVFTKGYLGTDFSWPESRTLFEIWLFPGINATELCEHLNMDKSYISRIIAKLEKQGLITRELVLGSKGIKKLWLTDIGVEKAKQIDAKAIEKISPTDKKRILRVLEIYHATGKTKTEQEIESRKKEVEYDYKVFALNWDREKLYERINKRVDIMFEQGLIQEVKNILNKYSKFPTAMQGLGYKEVVDYLNGIYTKEEMIEKIKMETRRYAKRQLTWFRKNKQTIWLNAEDGIQRNIEIIIRSLGTC